MSETTTTIMQIALASDSACRCSDPIPVQRAAWKGAAVTVCQRCGLRVPPRLR
jgi:hypothetical protein